MKKLGIALIVLGTGCVTLEQARQRTLEDFRKNGGAAQAAFDTDCPVDQLSIVDLTPNQEVWVGSKVGVSGCGKKVVYIATMSAGWVANSVTTTAEK